MVGCPRATNGMDCVLELFPPFRSLLIDCELIVILHSTTSHEVSPSITYYSFLPTTATPSTRSLLFHRIWKDAYGRSIWIWLMVESHDDQTGSNVLVCSPYRLIRSLASDLDPPAAWNRKETVLKYSETGPRLGRMSSTFSLDPQPG